MVKKNEPKKPGRLYWWIILGANVIFTLHFIFDAVVLRRFPLSWVWMLVTGYIAYISWQNLQEQKKKDRF